MFKNPLKYASGGTMSSNEQQAEKEFISVIAEGLGVQPEQVKARLEQIKSNPTESQQLQEALQLMQQDKNKGFQAVLSLFAGKPQSAKRGGKIQDFICKHARGGQVAGCGCEKSVLKGQEAIPGGIPRFQAPTNYYNEKGWPISERDAVRRNNRTFYTEEPTTAGNLAWTNNQMSSQLMWPGVVQDVQYNLPVGHYIDEYGNMHNFTVQGEDLTRYNNRKTQWKGDGGKVKKTQNGTRSLYQQIIADGPETYVDGYGAVRKMNESPIIAGLRKAYHWINGDRTLSDEAYLQKYGYSKPVIGMPPAVYISPVAQEINLAKYIGFRTPTQASLNQRDAATIKAEADRLKAIEAASKEGRYYVEPKPADLDIDKSYVGNSTFNTPNYTDILSKIANMKLTK